MFFNQVTLAGNMTRDCELRYTPKGTAVGQFGLAINRKWRDEGGTEREEVCFVDCTVWGRQAENLAQYMKKGSNILVNGRLKLDQWEDKNDHSKRSKLTVTVEGVQFGSSPNREGGQAGGGERGGYRPESRAQPPRSAPEPSEPDMPQEPDDVPF